jgi:hypothetical protein
MAIPGFAVVAAAVWLGIRQTKEAPSAVHDAGATEQGLESEPDDEAAAWPGPDADLGADLAATRPGRRPA